jgi:hypothetical protein
MATQRLCYTRYTSRQTHRKHTPIEQSARHALAFTHNYWHRSEELVRPHLVVNAQTCTLAHDLHAGRGASRWLVRLGDIRHRAPLDADGRVPAAHGVVAPHRHREPHLGTLTSLRLVNSARRAEALAEEARVSVGRHCAAIICNAKQRARWLRGGKTFSG